MTLNKNQKTLNEYLNGGNKLIQTNNRLYMDGEVVNTKTLVSLMYKLHGSNFDIEISKHVVIK
jgi:hypothetical protein